MVFFNAFQTHRRNSASMWYLQEVIYSKRALRQSLYVAYRYDFIDKLFTVGDRVKHRRARWSHQRSSINAYCFLSLLGQVKRLINALSVAKSTLEKSIWPITCVRTQMTLRSGAKSVANALREKSILPTTFYGKNSLSSSSIHITYRWHCQFIWFRQTNFSCFASLCCST